MKKALLLGAMALAASAATTAASAAEYGFLTASGGAYCDGVKFSGKAPATGYHIYNQTYCSGYPKAALGGYEGTVSALGSGKWYSFAVSNTQTNGLDESYVFTFYINTKALEWALAYESTDLGIAFEVINSGPLGKGAPGAMVKPGAKHLGSMVRETMASLKK